MNAKSALKANFKMTIEELDLKKLVTISPEEAYILHTLLMSIIGNSQIHINLEQKLAALFDATSITEIIGKKTIAENIKILAKAIKDQECVELICKIFKISGIGWVRPIGAIWKHEGKHSNKVTLKMSLKRHQLSCKKLSCRISLNLLLLQKIISSNNCLFMHAVRKRTSLSHVFLTNSCQSALISSEF